MKIPDIKLVKPIANHVLVKVSGYGKNSIKVGGTSFIVNTSYNPEIHTDPRGVVQALPEFLEEFSPFRKSNFGCMPYYTELDIRVGDTVFFDYLTYLEAMSDLINPLTDYHLPRYVIAGGELYLFIHYSRLYMAKSKKTKKIKMLNGWIMIEQLLNPRLILSGTFKLIPVKILNVGRSNINYASCELDDAKVNVGDVVLLRRKYGIRRLESWEEGDKTVRDVCLSKPKDIYGVVVGDLQELLKEEESSEFKVQAVSGLQYAATAWNPKEKHRYRSKEK